MQGAQQTESVASVIAVNPSTIRCIVNKKTDGIATTSSAANNTATSTATTRSTDNIAAAGTTAARSILSVIAIGALSASHIANARQSNR